MGAIRRITEKLDRGMSKRHAEGAAKNFYRNEPAGKEPRNKMCCFPMPEIFHPFRKEWISLGNPRSSERGFCLWDIKEAFPFGGWFWTFAIQYS